MKNKSTHISWIIVCILIAAWAFLWGMIYGEKSEKARITAGFIKVFQENFGAMSGSTTGINK